MSLIMFANPLWKSPFAKSLFNQTLYVNVTRLLFLTGRFMTVNFNDFNDFLNGIIIPTALSWYWCSQFTVQFRYYCSIKMRLLFSDNDHHIASLVSGLSPEMAAMLLACVIGGYTLIGGLGATFYVSYFNTALIFVLILMLVIEVNFIEKI